MLCSKTDVATQTRILDSDGLGEIFIAAFLLTGNVALAERSVMNGIAMTGCASSFEALLHATIRVAVTAEMWAGEPTRGDRALAAPRLPIELGRLLLLPDQLRQCFVLRVLLGISRGRCSQLLELDGRNLEHQVVAATLELASIHARENR